MVVPPPGSGQRFARQSHLRAVRVLGGMFPFEIEIPLGAQPVIFTRHVEHLEIGDNPKPIPPAPVRYFFGWSKEVDGKIVNAAWEFSQNFPPVHHEWVGIACP